MPHRLSRMFQSACVVALIVAVTGASGLPTSAAVAQSRPQTLKADLDGDGAAEAISLTTTETGNGDSSFTLTVNTVMAKRKSDYGDDIKMQVLEVDRSDRFKEIIVTTLGSNDFTQTFVFRYDGQRLIELLAVEGQGGVEFNGNGIALQSEWMGFWARKRKHQLDRASQRFRETAQELYYVGVEGKVKATFPVYERRGAASVVANTRAGSTMLVVACDPSPRCPADTGDACHWYLIKTESGLLGWVRLETLRDKAELPWAG